MYKLIIEDDEGKTTVVPLIRDEITIGRKEGNTIRLTERNVSRRHAKLSKSNGTVFIEDLESYNGIKVNGNKINGRVAVAEGDRIQIGDYLLGLRVEGEQDKGKNAPAGQGETVELPRVSVPTARAKPATAEAVATGQAAVETAAESPTSDSARMVCVSRNFAGLEALLGKPVMVLGRTPDNDIVINHRSISRHHAQIVEEAGRYTIMDMQSANGVRVNGEEYGKVELRRGDLVDLGHVRLRFVAPGEAFNFATDATIYDIGQGESTHGALWVGLSVVAVVAVGIILWHVLRSPASEQPRVTEQPKHVATTAPATKPGADAADQSELLQQIQSAMNAHDWQQVLEHCEDVSPALEASTEADCQLAAEERDAQDLFDQGVAAQTRNEHEKALEIFARIPKESVYYAAREHSSAYRQAKENYQAQTLREIEDLARKQSCWAAARATKRLQELTGDTSEAEALVHECRKAAADSAEKPTRSVARRPHSGPTSPAKRQRAQPSETSPPAQPTEPTKKAAAPTPEELAQAKETLDEAWKAYREGYYGRASGLARKVLKVMANQQALSIIGASACYLKRAKQAQSAYERLDNQRKQLLRRVCERMGVTIME